MRGLKSCTPGTASVILSLLPFFFGVADSVFAGPPPIDWPLLGFTQIVTNTFNSPVAITHAGDYSGRLFIVEQGGHIWIVQSNNVLTQPFLDISSRVLSAGAEQGLLGLAFSPGFSTNHLLYVDYTRQPDGAVVISRFLLTSTNSNVADANSEQIVMVIPKPYDNHNGGQLAFGPDGYLYIGVGDGGSEGDPLNNGQKTSTLLGKLLRIDVETGVSPYAVPSGNPFVGNSNYAPEIWALGLRNPWRFSFDRLAGDLYIGDVGQDRFEEIDFQPADSPGGQNYGWRIMEGPSNYNAPPGFTNFAALTLPVAWYDHVSLPTHPSAAVTGGYVFRGPGAPRMGGMYFYGDFIAGWIWGLKQVGTNWQAMDIVHTNFYISTFGEDEQGGLYLADYYRGRVYQIQDTPQVWPPTLSPTGGTLNANTVTVTCVTPDALIHYTGNGLDPTESDPSVSSGGTIQVGNGTTNKLRAFRADLLPSTVVSAIFALQVGTPSFAPAQGQITNGTQIIMNTVTPGAAIYYTLNSNAPTIHSPVYSGPITINGDTTVEALGAASGYDDSAVQSVFYPLVQAAVPAFNPSQGPLTNGALISMNCATTNATIRYTLDGTAPDKNSTRYSGPLTFTGPITLKARAFASQYDPSDLQSVFYGLLDFEHTVVTTIAGGPTAGFTNAFGMAARFSNPQGICVDSFGNLYVADTGNNVIRKVAPSGRVTVFAGSGIAGSQLGQSTNAQFNGPTGVCLDAAGNVYVADGLNCNRICKIDTNRNVTLAAYVYSYCGFAPLNLWQVVADRANNIYVGAWHSLWKIMPNGASSEFAGDYLSCCAGWGTHIGPGVDAQTNIYSATQGNLWQTSPNGSTILFAGGNSSFSDGPRLLSGFQDLQDAVVDSSTDIFVSENTRIRRIRSDGWVRTVAGTAVAGYQNGVGSMAQFNGAAGLCADTNGNIYVADSGNNCIREISPDTYGIGIPDWWQLAHFGYLGIDPNADPDHDGMSNKAEFWAGTDPNDPNSVFKIVGTSVNNGRAQISWNSVLGKTYLVGYSNDLLSWNTLGNPIPGNGPVASFTDPTPLQQRGARFYRISLANF